MPSSIWLAAILGASSWLTEALQLSANALAAEDLEVPDWISEDELFVKYKFATDPLEDLIESGRVELRPNPGNPGLTQYKVLPQSRWMSTRLLHKKYSQKSVSYLLNHNVLKKGDAENDLAYPYFLWQKQSIDQEQLMKMLTSAEIMDMNENGLIHVSALKEDSLKEDSLKEVSLKGDSFKENPLEEEEWTPTKEEREKFYKSSMKDAVHVAGNDKKTREDAADISAHLYGDAPEDVVTSKEHNEADKAEVKARKALSKSKKQDQEDEPTKPGCYVFTKSGCTQRKASKSAPKAGKWMKDPKTGSDASLEDCEDRSAEYNKWCKIQDSHMLFVPLTEDEEDIQIQKVAKSLKIDADNEETVGKQGKDASSLTGKKKPGCYVFSAVGCKKHSKGPKAGKWMLDVQDLPQVKKWACESRRNDYNRWCSIEDVKMAFVPMRKIAAKKHEDTYQRNDVVSASQQDAEEIDALKQAQQAAEDEDAMQVLRANKPKKTKKLDDAKADVAKAASAHDGPGTHASGVWADPEDTNDDIVNVADLADLPQTDIDMSDMSESDEIDEDEGPPLGPSVVERAKQEYSKVKDGIWHAFGFGGGDEQPNNNFLEEWTDTPKSDAISAAANEAIAELAQLTD